MLKIMTQQTPSENRSLLPKTTGFEAPQLHTFNNPPPPPNERFQSNWRLEDITTSIQANKNIVYREKIKNIFSRRLLHDFS